MRRPRGPYSLEEVRAGDVQQVEADVLELAGNFLLRTRGHSECAGCSLKRQEGGKYGGVRGPGCRQSQVRPEARAPAAAESEGQAASGPQSEAGVGLRKKGQGLGYRAFGNDSEGR